MNNNFNPNPSQESPTQLRYGLYNLFSKGVFLVFGISSVATAFFLLCKTIITAVTATQDDILQSLYYFFGSGSVPFVNLITGLLAVLFFGMLALSMFRIYGDAKRTSSSPTPQSFVPLIVSLVFFIILAVIITITAFASLSVISYQNTLLAEDSPNILQPRNSAITLFVPYVLFAAAAIMTAIGLLRLTVSIKNTVSLTNVSNAGTVVSMIALISGAFLCTCDFMSNLSLFLMPSYLMGNSHQLNPTLLIVLMLSTLISASTTVMLISSAVIVSRYNDTLHKVFHYRNNPYIAQYATNVAPQEQNRRPMPQPSEYQPINRYGYQAYTPAPMPAQKFPQAPQNPNQQFISQPYNQYSTAETNEPVNLTKETTEHEKTEE
ncbi:MAG: hypothetical protein ACI4M3_01805 [Acutalibacteraceae bacterium]